MQLPLLVLSPSGLSVPLLAGLHEGTGSCPHWPQAEPCVGTRLLERALLRAGIGSWLLRGAVLSALSTLGGVGDAWV